MSSSVIVPPPATPRTPPIASPPSTHPLLLTPLPETPLRTSSSISFSGPTNVLPNFSLRLFVHAVTAHVRLTTSKTTDLPLPNDTSSRFYGIQPPDIITKAYVDRLITHAHCSASAFIVALVYLRRIAIREPKLKLCPENLHRLFVTALLIAIKHLDDRVFSMRHYARVGGVPTPAELARLERDFLRFINYRIFVRRSTYARMLAHLHSLTDHPLGSVPATSSLMHANAPVPVSSTNPTTTPGLTISGSRYSGRDDDDEQDNQGNENSDGGALRNSEELDMDVVSVSLQTATATNRKEHTEGVRKHQRIQLPVSKKELQLEGFEDDSGLVDDDEDEDSDEEHLHTGENEGSSSGKREMEVHAGPSHDRVRGRTEEPDPNCGENLAYTKFST